MLKRTALLFLVLTMLYAATYSQERTIVRDTKAAKMLLGRHKLSLQWISWDYFGAATVTNKAGVYQVKGEQKGRGNGDFLRVDGVITEIDAR